MVLLSDGGDDWLEYPQAALADEGAGKSDMFCTAYGRAFPLLRHASDHDGQPHSDEQANAGCLDNMLVTQWF